MFIISPVNRTVLIDLDQVCVAFHVGATQKWRERYPNEIWIDPKDMTKMYAAENYPSHLQEAFRAMMYERGFFKDLPPIAGAIEKMDIIASRIPHTYICTKPAEESRFCLQEKDKWVRKHLSHHLANTMIFAPNKTLIQGHLLVDDMPEILGAHIPTWEHLLFDAPYNRHVTNKRRVNWSNILEALEI